MLKTIVMSAAVLLALTAAASAANAAGAQPAHVLNIGRNTAERQDSIRDVRTLQALLSELDRARARNDRRAMQQVDERVRRTIASELAESRREILREPNERFDAIRYSQILEQYESLSGKMTRQALDTKRALLNELILMANRELREDTFGSPVAAAPVHVASPVRY